MRTLFHDLSRAFLSLRSRPGYVAVSVLTLALGIGATTAVFSVIDALLLRRGPYRNAHELFDLLAQPERPMANVTVRMGLTADALAALDERRDLLAEVATYAQATRNISGGDEPAIVALMHVSAELLPMLGVPPQLGRLLMPDDFAGANGPVVLISDRLWREQLGGDPAIVGQSIELDDVRHVIVGVMPRDFAFPRERVRGWLPMPRRTATAPSAGHTAVVRLQPNAALEDAARELRAMAAPLQEKGILAKGFVPVLQRPQTINPSERTPLLVLLGAVALVLGIACVNVMSLALTQGTVRRRELAICTALGASRGRLARQLLLENVILGTAGGGAGAALAYVAVTALSPLIPTSLTFLSANAVRVDGRVLLFTLAITLISAVVAGMVPSWHSSRTDVIETLKSSSRAQSASTGARRALWGASVVQCSLAVVLLVGATLLLRSFIALNAVDPGFDTRNLLILQTQLPQHRYPDAVTQMAFNTRILEQLAAVPGVAGVTVSGGAPPSGGALSFGYLETDNGSLVTSDFEVPHMPVAGNYFAVMNIPLVAGRGFEAADTRHTVIINDVFANRYWGSTDNALGRRFRLGSKEDWYTVVGVSRDVKATGLDDRLGDGLEFYYPWNTTGRGWGVYYYTVRTSLPDAQVLPVLRERFRAADPRAPILRSSDSRSYLLTSIARPRFFVVLLTLFAGIATAVAAVGIYAVFAYSVSQRRHELGVRMALGATGNQMLRLVISEGLVLAATGTVLGLGGAWMLSRTLQTLLFQVTPTDPLALGIAAACLLLLAAIACSVPALRAKRLDPLVMLKVE